MIAGPEGGPSSNMQRYEGRFPLTASRLSPFAFRLIIFAAYRRGSITNRGEPGFGREASRRNLVSAAPKRNVGHFES